MRVLYSSLKSTVFRGISSFLQTSSANNRSSFHGQSPASVPVVSCQLIINIPLTSYPCCFSRYAATLESTPPEIPTVTRFFTCKCSLGAKIAKRDNQFIVLLFL